MRPRLCRMMRVAAILAAGSALVVAGLAGGAYHRYVVQEAAGGIDREQILEIISEESPVYYRDGHTRLGVFFAREHRDYVPFERIPEPCVQALVAAEDDAFFRHPGVDIYGILRAAWVDLKAGAVVQGGSTLTQQTAKNLFYRRDRSWRSKLRELVLALQLERRFSKEEILEFYFNQFHVAGNGRGIGIAARYFFDRRVEDLDLHRCAFMAGMVKAPARYDPWTGGNEAARAKRRERARIRTAYVLRRMREVGVVSEERARTLAERPVPFRRGTFRYDRSVVLDAVEAALQEPPIADVLQATGYDQAGYGGLRIVTTLDEKAQRATTWGLWHHLSELGPFLEGSELEGSELEGSELEGSELEGSGLAAFAQAGDAEGPSGPPPLRARGLYRGEVKHRLRASEPGGPAIEVAVGEEACRVDASALERAARIVVRAETGDRRAQADASDVERLLDAFPPGTAVRVSVRPRTPATGSESQESRTCHLEALPRLQGAALVLEDGAIRAMVGGNRNRDYNRALHARRGFGSAWKPLVILAALELGWSPADALDNRPAVFPFEGTVYRPHAGSRSEPAVSLAWAGVGSETLATVWLLYHLVDRLDPEAVARLARRVDLAPRQDEDRMAWIRRIRDRWGVIAEEDRREEMVFEVARHATMARLETSGHPGDRLELRSLLYGTGLEGERERVLRETTGEEREALLRALDRTWLRLAPRIAPCRAQAQALYEAARSGTPPPPEAVRDLYYAPSRASSKDPSKGKDPKKGGAEVLVCRPGDGAEVSGPAAGERPVSSPEARAEAGPPASIPPEDALVDGILPLGVLEVLDREMETRLEATRHVDVWEPEVLYGHPDFRRLLGLRYVAHLAAELAEMREIPPVLSLPLGDVEASLVEMASLYQGFRAGRAWHAAATRYRETEVPGLLEGTSEGTIPGPALIHEIRNRSGQVLYRSEPVSEPVVSEGSARLLCDVLRNTVRVQAPHRSGGGGAVRVGEQDWPLLGSPGTSSGYRDASFVGIVPRYVEGQAGLEPAFTVAIWLGYDDETPMRRGAFRVSGLSGAMPAWMAMVEAMGAEGLLGTPPADAASPELPVPHDLKRIAVDPATGLPRLGAGEGFPDAPHVLVRSDRRGTVPGAHAPR